MVEFTRQQIIQELGWTDRFRTNFNHELVVDRQRYQPISSTIDLMDLKIEEHNGGYIFLIGGPGSGKSTLLNQWSKTLKERVVRYYAFDFTNPSSHLNYYERGNATNLFFDLVFQLKEAGIYKREVLPYKDIVFLKEVFSEQIKALGVEYLETRRKTLIIIDGLDHVPREYKSAANSFLRELPLPSSLPDGVLIALGSQSYDLSDIPQEIKAEFLNGNKSVKIDPLNKENVYNYVDSIEFSTNLSGEQKLKIYEKSQGHPLYLSYLVGKILKMEFTYDLIDDLPVINGDIDNYYKKIWEPIEQDANLIQFLGLISRINGLINIRFIQEWQIDISTLKSFKEKARILFNEENQTLSFFHNSFKQFLLSETSTNYLTSEFDLMTHRAFHKRLAEYYKRSNVEKTWKQNHHLFEAGEYDEFITVASPDYFTFQLLNFRPTEDIKKDIKLGIEIGRQRKDLTILVRYLFCSDEIEKRLINIDPASFTEELLKVKRFDEAVGYLRTGNVLHCKEANALEASRLFFQYDYKSEAEFLYNLAYPEIIKDSKISIDDTHRYEELRQTLEEWICTASYFEPIDGIISIIKTIKFTEGTRNNRFDEKEEDLILRLIENLGYSLINQNKWDDLDRVFANISGKTSKGKNSRFHLIKYTIEECLENKDIARANTYLTLLNKQFTKDKATPRAKIFTADLIYKVTQNITEVQDWIQGVEQPSNEAFKNDLSFSGSIDVFLPRIKLNTLLNICGQGMSIVSAVPAAPKGSDEDVLVEFERMLCLISQILSEGILEIPIDNVLTRMSPIVRYYYRDVSSRNRYWYKLTQCKGEYFNLLIYAVSKTGSENLKQVGNYLFSEFDKSPQFWDSEIQRKIMVSLLNNGFSKDLFKNRLETIEPFMLEVRDIDGRITECLSHAKAYLLCNEDELGEHWLKQAVQESIGVGYRKDYQFNDWILWLKKINKLEPADAPNRNKWFLSHLKRIKETTEGRAFWEASEQLLGATLEHNLNDGLEQLKWQVEYDLINFTQSMAFFIKHYIKRVENLSQYDKAINLYNCIYLLLDESGNTILLKDILNKGYEIYKEDFLKAPITKIIESVNIKSFEVNRYYLLTEIKTFFLSIGHEVSDYYPTFKIPENNKVQKHSSYSNTLVLKDQKTLIESEVIEQVKSFDDFTNLLQGENKGRSYFNWSKVINKIVPLISLEQLKELAENPHFSGRGSEFYALLSEAAYNRGDSELAEGLAHKSIELSSESGWVIHYDGGTRILAFNALKKVNPSLALDKGFEVFSNDIISSDYPSSYIHNLDDILPLLKEEHSIKEIWKEVYSYLKRLMANSRPQLDLPTFDSLDYSTEKVFTDYLVYLLTSPVSIIKEEATIILAKCIDQDDKYASEHLLNRKLDDYSKIEILIALFKFNSPKLTDFIPIIKDLALSNDFELRNNAIQILESLNEILPTPRYRTLPGIYSLHVPEIQTLDLGKEEDPYFPDLDLNNPIELTRPFGYLVGYLSEVSGIEESNLLARAQLIMKMIGDENEWTVEYEKTLRHHLEEIGLEYSFHRPRVKAAYRAIMQIATELVDSNLINHNEIKRVLISKDYNVSFFPTIKKPSFIQAINEREFGEVSKEWIDKIEESDRLKDSNLLIYSPGFKIIAEYTLVKKLDWGSPSEEYSFHIAPSNLIDKSEHYIFGSVFHQLSENYHSLSGGGHFIVVIRDHRFNQFNIKSRWIAINPVLARYFGWLPEPSKLFAWKNPLGDLMVESIYWSNGNSNMAPRKDGEVGEGWFVVLSDVGLKEIQSLENNLFVQKKLTRSKYDDGSLREKMMVSVSKIP